MVTKIQKFTGKYKFLSNFYPCFVQYEGVRYPSVEHAYQAAKTLDRNTRTAFSILPTASDAKKLGRKLKLRNDWEQVKEEVMYECLKSKFSNKNLKEMLLQTGYAHIEEGNNHGDMIWGTVNGEGQNKLGKLLMRIREEIKQ